MLSEYHHSEQQPKIQLFQCRRSPGHQSNADSPPGTARLRDAAERDYRDLVHLQPTQPEANFAGIREEDPADPLEPPNKVQVSIRSSKTPTSHTVCSAHAARPDDPASTADTKFCSPIKKQGLP